VLLAHPDPGGSRVNSALTDAIRDLDGIHIRDLATVRRVDGFDAAEEQRLLVEHDSVPGILKEWMDQVLLYGFAYGAGGTKLQGKTLQVVTTTGGPGESYRSGGYNRFTMSDLLRPLDATAHLCGMTLAEPFVVHGARTLNDSALAEYGVRYRALLDCEELRPTA
jgi:glutathione-regulated potassium-efflux system ancillary protein KefG